ncbi:hypothetical protein LTR40_010993, partial [Exophiala xenobiotica]
SITWRLFLAPLILPNINTTIIGDWLGHTLDLAPVNPNGLGLSLGLYLPSLPFYQSLAAALTTPTILFPLACAVCCIFLLQPSTTDWMLYSVTKWSVTILLWRLGHLFAIHVLDRLLEYYLLERASPYWHLPT